MQKALNRKARLSELNQEGVFFWVIFAAFAALQGGFIAVLNPSGPPNELSRLFALLIASAWAMAQLSSRRKVERAKREYYEKPPDGLILNSTLIAVTVPFALAVFWICRLIAGT
jgi:hypothetical protein